jgi:threonine dehydratase
MARPTPLERAPERLAPEREVLLKREDVHELGSFKWRGALPTLAGFAREGAAAVVTASTGNHGVATAWAAAQLGLEAIVFVPESVSRAKLRLLERLEASIRLTGPDLDAAKEVGRGWAAEQDLPFFEDGAEAAQVEGYGAIADELLAQLPAPPGTVIVPVGNGALLAGIGKRLADGSPETLRVGVVAKDAPVMAESWHAKQPLVGDRCATFADGLAVRVAIPVAVEALATAAQRMVMVSERELARAVGAFAAAGIRVEGAGAAPLAALRQLEDAREPIVLVVSGRNIDDEAHTRAVEQPDAFPA